MKGIFKKLIKLLEIEKNVWKGKKKNMLDCITQVDILEEKISELEIKTEENNFKWTKYFVGKP